MRSQITGNTPAGFHWKVKGKPVHVEFSRPALDALGASLEPDGPESSRESGGILLGAVEAEGDTFRTQVRAVEPLPIEGRYGPSYVLSPKDGERLERRLRQLGRGALRPVGLYRTHERRGLYLDQRDYDLFRLHFLHPGLVFLLVGRDEAGHPKAGVFIWEGDDIQRHSSYLEFPLEVSQAPRVSPAPPRRLRLRWRAAAALLATAALPVASFYAARWVAMNRSRSSASRTVAANPGHDSALAAH